MTTRAEAGWAAAVRGRLGPGLLLPLGDERDGVWLAERAARTVLLRAAGRVDGVIPGRLRVGLVAAPEAAAGPADSAGNGPPGVPSPVPPGGLPPGGLPPGPLGITAEFAVSGDHPLPALAEQVRAALCAAAETELGLRAVRVDLRVTELVGDGTGTAEDPDVAPPPGHTSPAVTDPVAVTVRAVAGVAALTDALGPPVHRAPDALRVECAVTAGRRALDVARAVRAALTAASPAGTAVTVLVSEVR